jgi:hypothetical protein
VQTTSSVFWLDGNNFVGREHDDFEPRRWSGGLIRFRGGAPLLATFTTILETSSECGAVWWVWGSPHTRRGVLSGRLAVPTHAREASNGGSGEASVRWVASDWVFSHAADGRLGCSSTAVLGPARWWPSRCGGACSPLILHRHWITSVVSIPVSVVVGGSYCCTLSPLSSLVVFWPC